MATVGERIAGAVRAARRKKGMTQEALAEAVGLAPESVSRIENGTTASIEHFVALARALHLDIGKVLGVDEPERNVSLHRLRKEAEILAIIEGLSDTRLDDLAAIAKVLSTRR